jgi:hypothetical protein
MSTFGFLSLTARISIADSPMQLLHQWRFAPSSRLRIPHLSQVKTSVWIFLSGRIFSIRLLSRLQQEQS